MDEHELATRLGKFPTGNLCNAHVEVMAVGAAVMPILAGTRIAGPARTAKSPPGQNAAIHHAVHVAKPGEILVVDMGGHCGFGPFGDILAACCVNQGIVGLVIDGTVRDTAELREMRFPVFCRGANPMATAKSVPGDIDTEIRCGEALVRPGDFLVGDDDGVVVIPRELATDVAEHADAVMRREEEIKAWLASGETTYEIFGLGKEMTP